MSVNQSNNPFLALISDSNEAEPLVNGDSANHNREDQPETIHVDTAPIISEPTTSSEQNEKPNREIGPIKSTDLVNDIVEDIFCITLKNLKSVESGERSHLVYLEDVAASVFSQDWIDLELLEHALFERLLLEDPANHIIVSNKHRNTCPHYHVVQRHCVSYLYECYERLTALSLLKTGHNELLKAISDMVGLVVRNTATALKQPELYVSQQLEKQVVELFSAGGVPSTELVTFFAKVAEEIVRDEAAGQTVLSNAFRTTFQLIHNDLDRATILLLPMSHFVLLNAFAGIPQLAEVIMEHSAPTNSTIGRAYANTMLGAAFNISCLPKTPDGMYEFFEQPLQGVHSTQYQGSIWAGLETLCDALHRLIHSLLRVTPRIRNKTLAWLGSCLDANAPRGRIWDMSGFSPNVFTTVSDGFALNLAAVLLRLAKPFISNTKDLKYLKIDPTYSAVMVGSKAESEARGVHCRCFANETCLLPLPAGGSPRPTASRPYAFLSDCFHLTHKALDLGPRVVVEKAQAIYRDVSRLQATVRDGVRRPGLAEQLTERIEMEMSRYLSLRCSLLEPSTLTLVGQFHVVTSQWLVQVTLDVDQSEPKETFAPLKLRPLTFPLPAVVPNTLRCVPEMLVENVASHLLLVRRFNPSGMLVEGIPLRSSLESLLSMMLVLMGSSERATNPHLRARLAECLECLLPSDELTNAMEQSVRRALFVHHPHREQIVECLLDVFVSIEMTGQSVSFEQKFNYRRPMYTVMDYLWTIDEHKQAFRRLSREAEARMEAVTPPLFLRFLNLLMNDAVFLLDEALSNMAQLRQMHTERESGAWGQMTPAEQERNEANLQHVGMMARFDNILGRETIHALEYLSSETRSIFCHVTMADRIAAMLNYFLLHLVGPEKNKLKVKDMEEYKFSPAVIVLDICKIYVNLSSSDEFCAAVSRDGRSYSPRLFTLAQDVLERIVGGSLLLTDLLAVAAKVAKMAALQRTEEEALAEAPEEFLDPIMSTLMSDPVILPSSKITVDRATIARHLLSDQSDPFNRSGLTMDMVQSNTELKERIEQWVAERKQQHGASSH